MASFSNWFEFIHKQPMKAGHGLKSSLASKTNTEEKKWHTYEQKKTVQTENVSNGEVILKGCISGQKRTCLSKQAQWRTFRQFRVSEESYFNQFSWIQCSKLRVENTFSSARILETFVNNIRRDAQVEGHSRNMWTSVLIAPTLTDLIVAAIYVQFTMS